MQSKFNKYLLDKRETYKKINLENLISVDILDYTANLLQNGADIIELYAPNTNTKKILEIGKKLRELTGVFSALFIIHDRIDIAKLLEADGIILDETSMSIAQAEKLIEGTMLIGYYANNHQEALIAQNSGADFLLVNEYYKVNTVKQFLS